MDLQPPGEQRVGGLDVLTVSEHPAPPERIDDQRRADRPRSVLTDEPVRPSTLAVSNSNRPWSASSRQSVR